MQNNSFLLECINKINKRKNAKHISIFDFSSLEIKIPHDKLVDIVYKIEVFAFKGGARDCTVIKKQDCVSWSSKRIPY